MLPVLSAISKTTTADASTARVHFIVAVVIVALVKPFEFITSGVGWRQQWRRAFAGGHELHYACYPSSDPPSIEPSLQGVGGVERLRGRSPTSAPSTPPTASFVS